MNREDYYIIMAPACFPYGCKWSDVTEGIKNKNYSCVSGIYANRVSYQNALCAPKGCYQSPCDCKLEGDDECGFKNIYKKYGCGDRRCLWGNPCTYGRCESNLNSYHNNPYRTWALSNPCRYGCR